MPRFKITAGKCFHYNRLYSTGDIIESKWDLRKQFVNKFELVAEDTPLTERPLQPEASIPVGVDGPPVLPFPAPVPESVPERAKPGPKPKMQTSAQVA